MPDPGIGNILAQQELLMKVRSTLSFVTLASALCAGVVHAQAFEYATGPSRYKIVSQQKITQEMMGQKNEAELKGEQLISVNVDRKSKDTLSVNVVVDSISMVHSMAGVMDLSSAKGLKVSSLISPTGVVYSSTFPDSGMAAEVGDDLARILPRISRTLAVGATWVDTLGGKTKRGGIDLDRTTIANSKVVGDTTIDGDKAWKIARASESKLSGSGSTQGQPVTLEATSTGNAFVYVSPKGTFVKLDGKEDIKIKITLVANGMEIGMNMENTQQLTRLK